MRLTARALIALLCILASTATAASCDDASAPPALTATVVTVPTAASGLPVIALSFDGGRLFVEVAQTPEDRGLGLGGRDALAPDAGMLFDSGESRVPSFSMRGLRFPLDFIWVGEDKRITAISADAPPEPGVPNDQLRRYSSGVEIRYVLEINAGAAARLRLEPGDQLMFEVSALQ